MASFKEKIALLGVNIVKLKSSKEINTENHKRYPNANDVISCTEKSVLNVVSVSEKTNHDELESVDLAIIEGYLVLLQMEVFGFQKTNFN